MSYLNGAIELKRMMTVVGSYVPDSEAVKNILIYPEWKIGIEITQEMIDKGQNRYRHKESLYKTIVAHTTIENWNPELAPTVWTPIDVEHSGTIDDPIVAAVGLEYVYGFYYLDPEDGNIYLCERQGEAIGGTIQLYYLPHQLIGNYFTLVEIGQEAETESEVLEDDKTSSGLLTEDE